MSNEVAVAMIGFAGVCVGAVFGYLGNSKKQAVINAQREQAQQDFMEEIKKDLQAVKSRLDKHNGYAELFHKNSEKMAVFAEKQTSTDKKLDSIQKDIEFLKSDRCNV